MWGPQVLGSLQALESESWPQGQRKEQGRTGPLQSIPLPNMMAPLKEPPRARPPSNVVGATSDGVAAAPTACSDMGRPFGDAWGDPMCGGTITCRDPMDFRDMMATSDPTACGDKRACGEVLACGDSRAVMPWPAVTP